MSEENTGMNSTHMGVGVRTAAERKLTNEDLSYSVGGGWNTSVPTSYGQQHEPDEAPPSRVSRPRHPVGRRIHGDGHKVGWATLQKLERLFCHSIPTVRVGRWHWADTLPN